MGHGLVGPGRQVIQKRFELQAFGFQLCHIAFRRDPQGRPPQEEAARPRIRHQEAIPTRKEFFFEQPNARGTIGSLEARAS